jgi:hypothetical protein
VRGGAREDVDFVGGGDRVRYAIGVPPTGGRLMVTAELWYQSIGYRWAHNLEAYRAPEIDRFVGYYEATAASSATRIAADTVTVEP